MKFQCEDCYQFLALVVHYQSQYAIFRILRQMATKIKKHEVLETEIRIHNLLIIVMKFDFKIYNYFFKMNRPTVPLTSLVCTVQNVRIRDGR